MTDQPILCTWTGEEFKPVNGFWAKRADRQYVVDARYQIEARQERSEASHRAFFASVAEAWSNLPEHLSERWASPDHLRKYALIKGGFHDERSIVCASKAEAKKVAAFIRPLDDYAIVTATDAVVRVFTAKSQSFRAMGKEEFRRSQDAVREIIAALIGVEAKQLTGANAA